MSPHDDGRDDFLDHIDKMLKAKTVKTTVIYKFSGVGTEGGGGFGGGSFGGGLGVGDTVGGGGVVTGVTDSTVTVNFPQGVPRGPINLPGIDTTVIVEQSTESPDEAPRSALPFGREGELVATSVGLEIEGTEIGQEVGEIRIRYELPHPGSLAASVRIQPRVLEGPRNDSTCGCSVFIASWDAAGSKLDMVELVPGQSIPEYRPPAGAVVTRFACAAQCIGDCQCFLSVKSALVS